jgi:hypothetical protein
MSLVGQVRHDVDGIDAQLLLKVGCSRLQGRLFSIKPSRGLANDLAIGKDIAALVNLHIGIVSVGYINGYQ